MKLIESLNWRYATKRMTGQKVESEKIDRILEATRLSASSMGLQPYNILVIKDIDLRKKIQHAAYNQPQITECSHLLVFGAWNDITEGHVNEYIKNIVSTRNTSEDTLSGFRQSLMNIVHNKAQKDQYEWAARQAYIAFGTAIVAAAEEKVDATPMEGFNPEQVDKLLNLREKGLRSVCMLALGYRDVQNDPMADLKKVRRDKEKLFIQTF